MTQALHCNSLHLLGLMGSNKVMAGELSRLSRRAFSKDRANQLLAVPPEKVGPGGIALPFAADLAALCVNYHRTSARVLWDLAQSQASRLEPLYDDLVAGLSEGDHGFWSAEATFSVLAFGTRSVEAGQRQVVGVVKNALLEVAARKGCKLTLQPDNPKLSFHARSFPSKEGPERLVVSLDLAGQEMHKRGYRTRAGEAPLREDLAANLVMLSRFDARREIFIDPLAGSGTLAVEAALMAAGKPVWMSGRQPAAAHFQPIAPELEKLRGPLFGDSAPAIYVAENDQEVYGTLQRSLETSGVAAQSWAHLGDFRDWDLRDVAQSEQGLILSNPPYGVRLGGSIRSLKGLYRDLGEWCRQFRGFRAGFIIGEPREDEESGRSPSMGRIFQECFGGLPRIKKPLFNGPLRAQFLLYDL